MIIQAQLVRRGEDMESRCYSGKNPSMGGCGCRAYDLQAFSYPGAASFNVHWKSKNIPNTGASNFF